MDGRQQEALKHVLGVLYRDVWRKVRPAISWRVRKVLERWSDEREISKRHIEMSMYVRITGRVGVTYVLNVDDDELDAINVLITWLKSVRDCRNWPDSKIDEVAPEIRFTIESE